MSQSGQNVEHLSHYVTRRGRSLLTSIIVALSISLLALPVQAAIRYVDLAGTNGGTCATPATACDRLTDAITAANPGDEIRVAKGTYTEPQITVSKQVTITGGYDPTKGGTLWETTNFTFPPTIFDGQNTNRLLYIPIDGVVLQYIIIRNGNATYAPAPTITRSFKIGVEAPLETLHMPRLEKQ